MKKLILSALLTFTLSQASQLTPIVTSSCNNNVNYVYYETPEDAHQNHHRDIRHLQSYPFRHIIKPFWDIRYINPVSKYENGGSYYYYPKHYQYTGLDTRYGYKNIGIGTSRSRGDASASIVQSRCIDGAIAGGTTINLWDAPDATYVYGGTHVSYKFSFGDLSVRPWKSNGRGNYMLQGRFDNPFWGRWEKGNIGGTENIVVYLRNVKTNRVLVYTITLYAYGKGRRYEKSEILSDISANPPVPHVSTVIKDGTKYVKKGRWSTSIQGPRRNMITYNHTKPSDWSDFFRVNITYESLKRALNAAKALSPRDKRPEDWAVTSTMIQYELEGGGRATITGSFWSFKTYITDEAW